MEFHTLGEHGNPVILLIHGALTPYEIMLPVAEHFTDKYRVIIPALDGHTRREESTFVSIENEAEKIENYLISKDISEIFCLCGLSLGGAIAHKLLSRGKIRIYNVILDGAPLVKTQKWLTKIMTNNYLDILRKSKARDNKTLDKFRRHFLPKIYLPHYLELIDKTSEKSIINMLSSVGESTLDTSLDLKATKLLYLHGTTMNEYLSKKSAKLIAKVYPEATVITFKGDSHCQCAIHEPEDWAQIVLDYVCKKQ